MAAAHTAARIPKPVRDCDIRSLPLGPTDAFVLSRLDGAVTEADLAAIYDLDPATLRAGLDRLCTLGAITFDGGAPRTPVPPPDSGPATRADADPARRVALANLLSRAMPDRLKPPSQPPPRRTGPPDSTRVGTKHAEEGDAQAELQDWYGASRAYIRAAAHLPDDWKVRLKAALALVKASGDLHQAAELAQQAMTLQPGRVEPRFVLAQVYIAARLPSAAKRELDGAEEIAPGDPRIAMLRKRLARM